MIDLTDTKHLHIEFKHEPMKNEAKSKKEGRPIFDDKEIVVIKFVGDRKRELVAPAHEVFTRDRDSNEWVTYAQAFPRHYQAFRDGNSALVEGTPLGECGFLTKAQVKELEAFHVHTVEQLAAMEGTALQKLGMFGRDQKNKAVKYLEDSKDKALEYRLKAENDDLRQRLAKLEAMAGVGGSKPDEGFAMWSDVDLKAFIKEQTGQAPRGTPSHDTLVQMAEEAQSDKVAA